MPDVTFMGGLDFGDATVSDDGQTVTICRGPRYLHETAPASIRDMLPVFSSAPDGPDSAWRKWGPAKRSARSYRMVRVLPGSVDMGAAMDEVLVQGAEVAAVKARGSGLGDGPLEAWSMPMTEYALTYMITPVLEGDADA